MSERMVNLPWLVAAPESFGQQIREGYTSSEELRQLLQRLSGYRLSGTQLHTLGTRIAALVAEDVNAVRLGVLSNGTTDLLLPALMASGLRHGVWLHVVGSDFDQVATEALNPRSSLNGARCHFVLLAIDHRGLPWRPTPGDTDMAEASLQAALGYVESICQSLQSASGCSVILQTLPQVSEALFGSLEQSLPGTMQWLIEQYNQEIRKRRLNSPVLLLNAAALAANVGLGRWHDPVHWTLGKFPFGLELVPLYADWVARLIAAARGRTHKCLVLDLDNTLWGGVIGDDGLAGIVLGNGSPTGEAFLTVQRMALALRERGILLAVSSKNDDTVARSAFRLHPEMLLKEQHISVFQANWQDKSSNLKAIASTLNIGLDSLVLLDDNPVERAQVREMLPMVAVPELPEDPAYYAEALLAAGYFEATTFTPEDRQRADQYQANAERAQMLGAATDLSSYLRSLEMKAICRPFDEVGRPRIAQLINKSNQFNLTTRRYTEAEVAALEAVDAGLTLQVRLIDRFGDNGIVVVVICREDTRDWIIDTWLMSCRVLNRHLEQATLNYLVACARQAGASSLIGQYLRSDRNGLVKEHYAQLGFECLRRDGDASDWRLAVESYIPFDVPIEIVAERAVDPSVT